MRAKGAYHDALQHGASVAELVKAPDSSSGLRWRRGFESRPMQLLFLSPVRTTSFIYTFESAKTQKKAPEVGFEPTTFPLGGGRAIHCATQARWSGVGHFKSKECMRHWWTHPKEPYVGIEPTTSRLLSECSTTKLIWQLQESHGKGIMNHAASILRTPRLIHSLPLTVCFLQKPPYCRK